MKLWFQMQKKRIKKWQRRIKAFQLLQKFFKVVIGLANKGITLWELYDKFLKDRLENQEN